MAVSGPVVADSDMSQPLLLASNNGWNGRTEGLLRRGPPDQAGLMRSESWKATNRSLELCVDKEAKPGCSGGGGNGERQEQGGLGGPTRHLEVHGVSSRLATKSPLPLSPPEQRT